MISLRSLLRERPEHIAWPAIPNEAGALMMALQLQFDESERWPPDRMRDHQLRQVARLAEHAFEVSPFWRHRLSEAGYRRGADPATWFDGLPPLTRAQAQAASRALLAEPVPPGHGGVHVGKTSGSTGTPMEFYKSDAAMLFWHAITLRDSIWHQRDLRGKLAAIRVGAEAGVHPDWGPAYDAYVPAPAVGFDAREETDVQIDWLLQERPQYLLTHASNLFALARRFIDRALRLESLLEVRTFSERLPEGLRETVRRAWNVPLTDMYSANEVGYVALQCPRGDGYHVQSEDVLVEIVDAKDRPCAMGETGRVLVTSLHNFAMPLLRYDLGDYACFAHACACGRTLPVLERILGRARNMMRLPGGGTAWPGFPLNTLTRLTAIRRLRMVQHSLSEIEVELELARELSAEEANDLCEAIRIRLQHPFNVRLRRVERISAGKFEDFECRMT